MKRIASKEYALATFHRSENVDNHGALRAIVNGLVRTSIPIVIPLHPRTKKRLRSIGLYEELRAARNIQLMPPQSYLDFLVLMKSSKFLITDSGGLQEEATVPSIRKRVIVLRRSTERLEAIRAGFAQLISLDASKIYRCMIAEWDSHSNSARSSLPRISPYGKGDSSERIVNILLSILWFSKPCTKLYTNGASEGLSLLGNQDVIMQTLTIYTQILELG